MTPAELRADLEREERQETRIELPFNWAEFWEKKEAAQQKVKDDEVLKADVFDDDDDDQKVLLSLLSRALEMCQVVIQVVDLDPALDLAVAELAADIEETLSDFNEGSKE